MGPTSPTRSLTNRVTGGKVKWRALPDGYDVYPFPGLQITAHRLPEQYAAAVCEQSPDEAAAIRRYFADVAQTAKGHGSSGVERVSTGMDRCSDPLVRAARGSALHRHCSRVHQEELPRCTLDGGADGSGDYGLPLHKASLTTHAMITASYFGGACWTSKSVD